MKFSHREHLLYYMLQGHVHLSKKDYAFYNNLQYIVKQRNQVTSNQNKLFDKLLVKYQRQLKKLGHSVQELETLSWKASLIESSKEFLEAYVYMQEDNICIRSPFNTQFIQGLRNINSNFAWDKNSKIHIAPYSTSSLKIATTLVRKHFSDFRFCDEINQLLDNVKEYQNCDWHPTLRKSGDHYYISGINHYLNEAIKDIELNSDPKTLFQLSTYGINIEDPILEHDPFKVFSGSYNITLDIDHLDDIANWLKLLDIKHVFTAREIIYNRQISNEIKTSLLQQGITCNTIAATVGDGVLLRSTNLVHSHVNMKRITKIIYLTNSRPVEVK
jgi:hypothetical protein